MRKFICLLATVGYILMASSGAAKVYWLPDFLGDNTNRSNGLEDNPKDGVVNNERGCPNGWLDTAQKGDMTCDLMGNYPWVGYCYSNCKCKLDKYPYTSNNCSGTKAPSGDECNDGTVHYKECIDACDTVEGVTNCPYGCKTTFEAEGCPTECKECYTDNCHNRTSVEPCDYGCESYFSDCSSKCQKCYADNCRNRVDNSTDLGCDTYWSDCSTKCEVGKTCVPTDCSAFTLTSIPANASSYDTCKKGCGDNTVYYKATYCTLGYLPINGVCELGDYCYNVVDDADGIYFIADGEQLVVDWGDGTISSGTGNLYPNYATPSVNTPSYSITVKGNGLNIGDLDGSINVTECPHEELCDFTDYPLETCPANGNCTEYACVTVIRYRLDSCKTGYTKSGNSCVASSCASGYAIAAAECGSSFSNGSWTLGTSYSGYSGSSKCYKCTRTCNSGYQLSGTTCIIGKSCIFVCDENADLKMGAGTVGAIIDWGDGSTTTVTTANSLISHDYATVGCYKVSVNGGQPIIDAGSGNDIIAFAENCDYGNMESLNLYNSAYIAFDGDGILVVDWGDGTFSEGVNFIDHTYAVKGDYALKIFGVVTGISGLDSDGTVEM